MYYKPIVDLFENNPNAYDFKLKIESKVSFSNTVKELVKPYGPGKNIMLVLILSDMQKQQN